MLAEPCPVVYISYGWNTIEHNGRPARAPDPRGRELAEALRAQAIDVRLDLYALEGLHGQRQPVRKPRDPRDPWHVWAMQQIAEADVVLMLCTPDYVQPDSGEDDALLSHLQPLAARHDVDVWTDREILPGDEWHLHIQNALDRARVGVMLVSPNFLKSDYIGSDELPKMLRAAQSEGLTIFWVPVIRTDERTNPIARFQAAHPQGRPLAELSKGEANKALAGIVKKLGKLVGPKQP